MALAYGAEAIATRSPDLATKAVDLHRRLLSTNPPGAFADTVTLSLAHVLRDRAGLTSSVDDLEEAARLLASVVVDPHEVETRLVRALHAAAVAIDLWRSTRRPQPWTDLGTELAEAIESVPETTEFVPNAISTLGVLLQFQARATGASGDWTSALQVLRSACEKAGAPRDLAARWDNLAHAVLDAARGAPGVASLGEAEVAAKKAVSLAADAHGVVTSAYLVTLGLVQLATAETAGGTNESEGLWDAAAGSFAAALAADPHNVDAAVNRGWTLMRLQQWQDAVDAFDTAHGQVTPALGRPDSLDGRLTWVSEHGRWSSAAAVAAVKAGSPRRAIEFLERDRLLLSQVGHRDREPADADKYDALVELTAGTPVIYLCATEFAGVAIIVTNDGARVVEASQLVVDDEPGGLKERLVALLDAYDAVDAGTGDVASWARALDDLVGWLGPMFIDDVVSSLDAAPFAYVVPVGPLSMVPWHATWRLEPGTPTGRLYAIDVVGLAYLPSISTLAGRRRPRLDGSFLAVGDPRPSNLGVLAAAPIELAGLRRAFPGTALLQGDQCTLDAVLEAMKGADVIHVASHAEASPWAPIDGYLVLSHDAHLTIGQLASEQFGAELVTLSACETNVGGRLLSDEALSMCYALLPTVQATVGSLWLLADAASAAVMTRFFDGLSTGARPADTLRDAQRWFRDASIAQIGDYLRSRISHTPSLDAMLISIDGRHLVHSHPLFWAPMIYTGVP